VSVSESPSPQPEHVLHEDALSYTPLPRSVTLARRRTARLVTAWGLPALAGDAALIVSELAGNAVLHGCLRDRLFRVRLAHTTTALRVEVADPRAERFPAQRTPTDDECFGRGLQLVSALATRWGVAPCIVGKTTWAELPIPPET
jgi:anti-sigma regulatory factor (Ser/Thr protein kinase)